MSNIIDFAKRTVETNRISCRVAEQIAKMRDYRTRLIADVVTGKLDVREVAAGLPEADSLP